MTFLIRTHKFVDKFLAKHPELVLDFLEKFEMIGKDPQTKSCDIKPLKNHKNSYRLRIGKYRFLYEIIEKEIFIFVYDADSRGGIYK